MAFKISENFDLMTQALHYRKIRQDLIASNIANVDTPFYKPKDIRFEEVLEKEVQGDENSHKLQLATTSPMHLKGFDDGDDLKPTIFYRDGHLARNDGNSVDIDVETTEMAKNDIAYNATIQALKKDIDIFNTVIDSTKNI